METFIVRLYRGGPASDQELAGTVERVGSGDRVGFSGKDQLLDCLQAAERGGDAEHHPHDRGEDTRTEAKDGFPPPARDVPARSSR
jgi:hypothetical protein